MSRRLVGAAAGAWLAMGWIGCNAILGNEDARFAPDAGGAAGDDGPIGAEASDSGADTVSNVDAADGAPCSGADLATDPHNCGVCGHDCLGGNCTAGRCGRVLLATDPTPIQSVAVDGANVYWTDTLPALRRAPLAGGDGGAGEVLHAGAAGLFFAGVAASGGRVYFTINAAPDAGAIASCDVAGCAGGVQTHASALAPAGVVASPTALYWADFDVVGAIGTCKLPGCTAPAPLVAPQRFPGQITADGDDVFWGSVVGGYVHAYSDGGVRSIIEDAGSIEGLAVNQDSVYTARLGNGIVVAPRDGGSLTATTFSKAAMQARDVAADATDVYFADHQTGVLFRCPRAACPSPVTLATTTNPSLVIVDAESVVWVDDGLSTPPARVWRLAK